MQIPDPTRNAASRLKKGGVRITIIGTEIVRQPYVLLIKKKLKNEKKNPGLNQCAS